MNQEALTLCVERADCSPVEKNLLLRKARKILKRGELQNLTPIFLYRLCCARMHLRDYSDYTGWEWRSDDGWSAKMMYDRQPLARWDGGYADRLWVVGEQGLGDEIFYASLLPECLARVKEVVYECDSRLHSIISRSFPRTICEPRQDGWGRRSGVFIPAADLLRYFRRSVNHFPAKPYLKPDPERVAAYGSYRGRTGVAFRGRQGSIDPVRLGLQDALNVQYGESHPCLEAPPVDIKDDIEGAFALVANLDRVVTVPQTIHHIAGSIGKRVEIIIPDIKGEIVNQVPWDYPVGKLPWYPDAVVYPSIKDWKAKCPSKNSPTITTLTTSAPP